MSGSIDFPINGVNGRTYPAPPTTDWPAQTTGITSIQSPSFVLREVFLHKLVTLPFFQGFNIRRTRRVPVKTDQVPMLAIYLPDELMVPDGNWNASPIKFMHDFRICFSIFAANNSEAQLESTLDAGFWAIANGLWRDEYICSLIDTTNPHIGGMGNPDGVRFEGIIRGTRKWNYGNPALNNETPLGEMQYDTTIRYRQDYPAVVTDELDKLASQTQFPSDHSGLVSDVQQVEWSYDYIAGAPFDPTLAKGANHGRNEIRDAQAQGPTDPGKKSHEGKTGGDR
jgi:hypothetical protein